MKAAEVKALFPTEAALCDRFLADLAKHGGWTAYPETAGFDILAVYDATGAQLGIEAKLQLNAKVADQILPPEYSGAMDRGPDFRAVLVPCITDANAGIARMLKILGVQVFVPDQFRGFELALSNGCRDRHESYDARPDRPHVRSSAWGALYQHWHDWNPVKRCKLPEIVPKVAAGVPCPVQLTPWKIGALKVMAALELDGHVTARQVRECGVDPRRFCASDGWLAPLGEGRWGRGTLPAFDQQHPEAYAELLAKARAARMPEQTNEACLEVTE